MKKLCGAAKRTSDKSMRYILLGFISSVAGFMVQSLTDYTFYNYRVMIFFWIIVFLGIKAAQFSEESDGGISND